MSQAEKDLIEEINAAVEAFQYLISERHRDGAERYGEITFLGNDVVRMMLEELADYQIAIDGTIHLVTVYIWLVLPAMMVAGALIGVVSSLLATRKYLKI
jgi:hypothetical protein